MMILSVLGFALAYYSATTFGRLFRTYGRDQSVDEPVALAATTGLIMLGWLMSAAAGAALIAFAMTSQIPR